MKKIYKHFILITVFVYTVCPIICKADSWSIIRNKDNKPPAISSDVSYINNYDAFYVDKNADDSNKVIYLTFDAGYENGNIEKILDTLKNYNAKGAFFVPYRTAEGSRNKLCARQGQDF